MLLLGQIHPKLGGSRGEDRPAQKWGRYELNNVRNHLLLLRRLVDLCHQFDSVHSFMLLKGLRNQAARLRKVVFSFRAAGEHKDNKSTLRPLVPAASFSGMREMPILFRNSTGSIPLSWSGSSISLQRNKHAQVQEKRKSSRPTGVTALKSEAPRRRTHLTGKGWKARPTPVRYL